MKYIRYLLMVIVFLLLAACSSQDVKRVERANMKRVHFDSLIMGLQAHFDNAGGYFVINNQKEWEKVKNNVPERERSIDFERFTVIAMFMPQQSSGGYALVIQQISETDKNIIVRFEERTPGPEMMVTMALTQPFHIVRIPKTEKKVLFEAMQIERDFPMQK